MRTLALTILTMGIVLTTGHARAQTYNPAFRQVGSTSPAPAVTGPDSYCLQGCQWGYPGNSSSPATPNAWPVLIANSI